MRNRDALAAALMLACISSASAEQIGRLFHSAAERNALNALRKAKSQPPVVPRAPAESQAARLDGYVVRSDGKSTLWLNGNTISSTR